MYHTNKYTFINLSQQHGYTLGRRGTIEINKIIITTAIVSLHGKACSFVVLSFVVISFLISSWAIYYKLYSFYIDCGSNCIAS